jgi:glycerophosphoryl diester phosphodiesterase
MVRLSGALLALLSLLACSSADPPAPVDPPAAAPWPPPAEVYDCRAAAVPERVSPVPASCATDRGCRQKMICGHRGVGGDLGVLTPENTVSAVRAAIAFGIEFIETDPRRTGDGVLVNVHDTDVARVTTGQGEVAKMTLEELRALPLRTGKYEGDFSCEGIATIEEILTAARGRIHVLLDANKTDDIAGLVAAVRATDTLDWAILDTDSPEKIEAALAIEPRLHTMIRVVSEAELTAELERFAAHPPVLVEIRSEGDLKTLVPAVQGAGHRAFTDSFVNDFSAGLQGDVTVYDELWATGVDVLQTDRPELVLRGLRPR